MKSSNKSFNIVLLFDIKYVRDMYYEITHTDNDINTKSKLN